MKILVCGSRDWTNVSIIRRELSALYESLVGPMILIHGDCKGADTIAGAVGRQLGFEIRAYPAKWEEHGRAAGPIRNSQMLLEEHPDKNGVMIDLVLAFHENLEKSKGTKDMVLRAEKAGIKVVLVGE